MGKKPNKHRNCRHMISKDGVHVFGSGRRDDDGYFEVPCIVCASEWKKGNAGAVVWPESDDVVCDPT